MNIGCKIARNIGLLMLLISSLESYAQFYNGHQMSFGKSRVQYDDFFWQYYRFPKFDTYFYVSGNKIARYVSEIAMEELEAIEYSMEEILQRRIIFIVYNKQSEFRQSNIGLVSGNEDYNIGGVTRIVDNKVFVYYEGNHNLLRKQIRASIAEIILNEMLYGGNFRDRLSSSAMLNLPVWYSPGLISYVAYDLDFKTEAKIKEGFITGKFQKIHRLYGDDAKYAGHAFWRYLSETYGEEIVSHIVYMTRVSKSVESGFLYVLGMPLKQILSDWFYFYEERYNNEVDTRNFIPKESKPIKKRTHKKRVYSQVEISPNGENIAYSTNQDGQWKIFIYNTLSEKTTRIIKRDHKLEQINDYSYPVLAWHPSSDILTYFYERRGHIYLDYYTLSTKEKYSREIFYLDKVLDYSFSKDGTEIVISALEDGYTDIFIYNVISSTFDQITKDIADDIHPKFIDANRIIFSSNRINSQLNHDKNTETPFTESYDLFTCAYKQKIKSLKRLTATHYVDELHPLPYRNNKYFFLTNKNGLFNRGFLGEDSTISYIDTAIHYRQFTKQYPISNLAYNINDYSFNPLNNSFATAIKQPKRYAVFTEPLQTKYKPSNDEFQNTWFRNYHDQKVLQDSLDRVELENGYEADSILPEFVENLLNDTLVDIDNYIFEIEKTDYYFNDDESSEEQEFKLPKQLVYFTNFYSNLLVTQVDFGFMNESYQAFTGNAFYFNPGFNILTKVGAIDLFEDYKITGGIRFSMDFESNEYLLSVENLKTRLDKQYIYHRQVFESPGEDYYAKIFTNEVMGVYKYPISQIHAFRGTLSMRLDEKVYKSLDYNSLNKPDDLAFWGGFKGEFILDNTKNLGLNLYSGTRMKVFGEYYNQMGSGKNSHLFVIGTDIRNYIPIHRDLIFASRFAASTSFGKSLLMYYLGGVDNWMNFSRETPTFDYSTRINNDKNWVYQAVATNMRGFVQNVRNGNSFALINAELRWPVIRYLINRPISNDLLNNFMLIGFTDVGSAWEGMNPFKADNAYDYQEISQPPVTIIVDKKQSPFVAGVGFGLRSRLLGYYIRTDWAWGINNGRVLPRVFYLSLCTDF